MAKAIHGMQHCRFRGESPTGARLCVLIIKQQRSRLGQYRAEGGAGGAEGDLTLSQLATMHGDLQTMIAAWRRHVTEELAGVFCG